METIIAAVLISWTIGMLIWMLYDRLTKIINLLNLQSGDVQKMMDDALRYQEVKKCDWIGLRVAGQEFVGVSTLDAWADARRSPMNRERTDAAPSSKEGT